MSTEQRYDVVVVGAGNAAEQGASVGREGPETASGLVSGRGHPASACFCLLLTSQGLSTPWLQVVPLRLLKGLTLTQREQDRSVA